MNQELLVFQKGFNYSQDGPGNRLVYHLQGCNMHCPWCANPEGIPARGCMMEKDKGKRLSCKTYAWDDILEEAEQSRPLFFDGGGVTFTGGEPTLQFETLNMLLIKLKERGISTALENNGSHPQLMKLINAVDYLMMDFKHPDGTIHKRVTGVSNEVTCRNLNAIFKNGRQIAIRIPLVNGFNTSKEALNGFLEFFGGNAGKQVTFEFLRYHEYGRQKWQQCGMEYTVSDGFVKDEDAASFEDAFQKAGLQVVHS